MTLNGRKLNPGDVIRDGECRYPNILMSAGYIGRAPDISRTSESLSTQHGTKTAPQPEVAKRAEAAVVRSVPKKPVVGKLLTATPSGGKGAE